MVTKLRRFPSSVYLTQLECERRDYLAQSEGLSASAWLAQRINNAWCECWGPNVKPSDLREAAERVPAADNRRQFRDANGKLKRVPR